MPPNIPAGHHPCCRHMAAHSERGHSEETLQNTVECGVFSVHGYTAVYFVGVTVFCGMLWLGTPPVCALRMGTPVFGDTVRDTLDWGMRQIRNT